MCGNNNNNNNNRVGFPSIFLFPKDHIYTTPILSTVSHMTCRLHTLISGCEIREVHVNWFMVKIYTYSREHRNSSNAVDYSRSINIILL